MTRVRIATLIGIAGAIACGVIAAQPVAFAPSNTCGTDNDCNTAFPDAGANASCNGGACVGGGAFRPILVVSTPSGSTIGAATFALPDSYILQQSLAPAGCGLVPSAFTCVFLPPLASIQNGYLLIGNGFGRALWPPGGLRPSILDVNPTTLPTRAIFHPMWVDPVSQHPMFASKLGLPLPDIMATQRNDEGTGNPLLLAPTDGTTPLPGFVFSALVPQPIAPTDPSAFYALEIIPSDPFGIFPPFVRPFDPRNNSPEAGAPDLMFLDGLNIAPSKPTLAQVGIDLALLDPLYELGVPAPPLKITPINIDEDVGAPSLEGWSASIVDVDGRRVSGLVILPAGATKLITLYEAFNMQTTPGQTLVIAPPSTLDMPSLEDSTGLFAASHTYYALPPVPVVQGPVLRTDQLGVQTTAHVTFFANGNIPSATLVHADNSPAIELVYDKIVATDAGGNYSTTLPPGNLRAYVVPDDPTLAITLNDNFQVSASSVLPPPLQGGKALIVNARTHVKGRVVLADGTPLYAATVMISASSDLPLAPNTTTSDPLLRPRDVQAMTDTTGAFDVLSDPGEVDISIRPQDGTKYPWVVLTSRTVPPSGGADAGVSVSLTLTTITIPLPTTFPPQSAGVLTDSLGNAIPNAIVSAYAFPAPATTVDGGTPQSRGARLLGMTMSDANGQFQLFVAPPDPE